MADTEFLVDAVAQFLQQERWLQAVEGFLEAHYQCFFPTAEREDAKEPLEKKVCSYTHEQFAVFTQFKDLVERLLEEVIGELGCTGEDLVATIKRNARPSGERRFFVKTLLSFDDYDAFCAKITQYAAEKIGTSSAIALSSEWMPNNRLTKKIWTAAGTAVIPQAETEMSREYSDWLLQLTLARSILEAKQLGQLDPAEESYLPWAEAFVQLTESNTSAETTTQEEKQYDEASTSQAYEEYSACETPAPDSSAIPVENEQMKELERSLMRERFKVDLLIAQRIADANAETKRQLLHLTAAEIAAEEAKEAYGNSDEEDLEALFKQVDKVAERLKIVKAKCFEFKNIAQDKMDLMYLFLKEKIHHHEDLVSQVKDISDFIFSHIEQSDAALVPLLLEWLLLESEAQRAQSQIHEMLGQGQSAPPVPDEGYFVQMWDENSQCFYYCNNVTFVSVWEPPACGYYDINNEFHTPEVVTAETSEAKDADTAALGPSASDAKLNASETSAALAGITIDDDTDMEDLIGMEQVLDRISKEHDEERKRLELVMQIEKARQKEELNRRREKKRRERLAKQLRKDDEVKRKAEEDNGTKATEKQQPAPPAGPPPPSASAVPPFRSAPSVADLRAEAKAADYSDGPSNVLLMAKPRIDFTQTLAEGQAKRLFEKHGLPAPPAPAQAMLNPSTVRYLTEQMAYKNPDIWNKAQEQLMEESEGIMAEEK
ncbi:TPA: hypothetical protein N0F65_012657 [Lagenidium giganteum]|uniref:Cilia- and flagella-associated protein 36 n=1 Tax=Lagenidium giganteum TaxID=4803 RepID=A0AAV2YIU6_9STRA|nr:TPA: hypothetical protein N0F65_012657 [Lagenidium giganteum]